MTIDERLQRIERLFTIAFKRVLNVSETALLLGISESRVRHMANEGTLPYSKPNGRLYFDKEKLERWLLSNPTLSDSELETLAATRTATSRLSKRQTR